MNWTTVQQETAVWLLKQAMPSQTMLEKPSITSNSTVRQAPQECAVQLLAPFQEGHCRSQHH